MDRPSTAGDDAQFVTLGLGRELFAVPVEAVREILDMRPVFRMPEAPPYLAGLINVRGRAVPVIDLRIKLGLPPAPADESTRILVLDIAIGDRRLSLGLIADRVLEVAPLGGSEITPPPDIGAQWNSAYIQGVGRRGDSFVIIFDLSRLFSTADVALIGAAASTAAATGDGPDARAAQR